MVWNDGIYKVLSDEIFALRGKGYRILMKGDFNGWVGNVLAKGGIPGNRKEVNVNGRRFKQFLKENNMTHLNGAVRVQGDWGTRVSTGVWTRHAPVYSSSTVLDYLVVSVEHLESIVSFEVDECGSLGGHSSYLPDTDPGGYLDKDFSMEELRAVLKDLGNGKAAGWDTITNKDSRRHHCA